MTWIPIAAVSVVRSSAGLCYENYLEYLTKTTGPTLRMIVTRADFVKLCGKNTVLTRSKHGKAFKLTEAQINEFTKAFNDFDQDGDGHLSAEELGVIMRSIGYNPTPKELQQMILAADKDGSGTIDLLEFLEIMARKSEEDSSEQDLREAFSLFDKDGNGVITAEELKFVLSGMGCEVSDDAAEEMIKQSDIDGDGGINFEEFLKLLKNRENKN